MSLLNNKTIWQSIWRSRLTLVLLLVSCFFLSFAVYDRFVVEREMFERRNAKEEELVALSEKKIRLEERVAYLSSEQGREAEIRKNFDVIREGEKVVVLMGEKDSINTTNYVSQEVSPQSWWEKFLNYLGF